MVARKHENSDQSLSTSDHLLPSRPERIGPSKLPVEPGTTPQEIKEGCGWWKDPISVDKGPVDALKNDYGLQNY